MKKMAMILAVFAVLGGNSAFAQSSDRSDRTGKGAASGCAATCNGGMVWLVALGSLAVLGTVVGLTASSSSSTPSTFGH